MVRFGTVIKVTNHFLFSPELSPTVIIRTLCGKKLEFSTPWNETQDKVQYEMIVFSVYCM